MHINHPAALQQLAEQRSIDLAQGGALRRLLALRRECQRSGHQPGAALDQHGPDEVQVSRFVNHDAWRKAA